MAKPKYKSQKIRRIIVKLGEHTVKRGGKSVKMNFFSRIIEPVVNKLGLKKATAKELQYTKKNIVYEKRGSLMGRQYTVIVNERTPKKNLVTCSIPVPDEFPYYKLRKLLEGKKNVVGIKTPLGVTHELGETN